MKKTCLYISVSLSGIFFVSINSCSKLEDRRIMLENGKEDLGQCSIRQLTQQLNYEPPDVAMTFAYNEKRDPVTVTFTPGFSAPFNIQWQLYYDEKARLSQFKTVYPDSTFTSWHVYFYDDKGRITGDSSYQSGQVVNRGTALYRAYSRLAYDNLNRIIKETDGNT